MADTTALKNRIRAAIKANNNQEITGPVLQDELLDIVDELNQGTENETSRAQNAESVLGQRIIEEQTRAEGAEDNLQQAIETEEQRAEQAEQALQAAINTEKTRAEGAENTLNSKILVNAQAIQFEKTRAEGAENTLQQAIETEEQRAKSAEQALQTAVNAEKTRAEGVEDNLHNLINDFANRGFIYKGIAPLTAPTTENKTFYIAKPGDYTGYTGIGNGSFTINGIAILTYDSSWSNDELFYIDEEPTPNSDNLVKSGGVEAVAGSYHQTDEYLKIIKDNSNRLLFGIKKDGDIVFGIGVPTDIRNEIIKYYNELDLAKIDKQTGRSLILDQYVQEIDNNDIVRAVVDSEGKILYGVRKNGEFFFCGIPKQIANELDKINEKIDEIPKNVTDVTPNYHRQDALLLRKHINDSWPYYLNVDISNPQTDNVDSYYDEKIRSIDSFADKLIFVTDPHWNIYNQSQCGTMNENDLMTYVKKRLDVHNVIFGGDANGENFDRHHALAVFKLYFNSALSAFGKDLIPVIGDHDNNTFTNSSYQGERTPLSFQEVTSIAFEQIQTEVVFDTALINQVDTIFSEETEDMRAEIKAWLKTHYYIDDHVQKTRYIVLFSGSPQPTALVGDFFDATGDNQSKSLFAQFDFIANAMMTTPEGYSIVFATHKVTDTKVTELWNNDTLLYRGSLTEEEAIAQGLVDPSQITDRVIYRGMMSLEEATQLSVAKRFNLKLSEMISAYKMKRSMSINASAGSAYANLNKLYSKTTHYYDFSTAPSVKKIFGITGHHHCDNSYLCGTIDGEYRSFYYQEGMELPEDTVLWLAFNTANCNRCHPNQSDLDNRGDGPDATGAVMTAGEVSETSFDVVAWDEEKIVCTRFGGGMRQERTYNY